MNNGLISVVLPTFNEREGILPLIEAIHQELDSWQHEIIVIDDNSSDGTFQVVEEKRLPFITSILRKENRGLAASIRCGIEAARGNIIVVMDSDFNHQPKYLPFMIEALQYYDCVTASRFLYGGMMESRMRHMLSWIFNIFTRILTKGMITDSLYGYFAIKRATLDGINKDDVFWGYGDYCIRLMYYLQQNRTSIIQFPAVNGQRHSGKGNSSFLKIFAQYIKEVIKLTYRIRVKHHV